MTDQARTPTTESIVAEIDALAIEYPDFDHAPFAIVGQGLLRRIRAALLAAEQREQALREALMDLMEGARVYYSNADAGFNDEQLMGECLDRAESALAAPSEPPATEQEKR